MFPRLVLFGLLVPFFAHGMKQQEQAAEVLYDYSLRYKKHDKEPFKVFPWDNQQDWLIVIHKEGQTKQLIDSTIMQTVFNNQNSASSDLNCFDDTMRRALLETMEGFAQKEALWCHIAKKKSSASYNIRFD